MGGDENISCPQCRRPSNIENFEHVEFTATQQWDHLLEIAQQFAAMEGELGPDTSEEEEEENLRETFIDDGDSEARFVMALLPNNMFGVLIACCSTSSQEHDATPVGMEEDESDRDDEGEQIPYRRSGGMEKRRRMKELVAQRERKRIRR